MDDTLLRLAIVLAIVAAAGLAGWWWRRRDGRVKVADAPRDDSPPDFDPDHLERVGLHLGGSPAGALLLSSPTCASCRQVQGILAEVEQERPDFRWVTVDAGEHLDLARAHHVLRVPTLFVLDPDGRILARTSGIPARHELERVIDRQDVAS